MCVYEIYKKNKSEWVSEAATTTKFTVFFTLKLNNMLFATAHNYGNEEKSELVNRETVRNSAVEYA